MRTKKLWLLAAIAIAISCNGIEPEQDGKYDSFLASGKADTAGITEGSPEALAILQLCNTATVETLDDAVGLTTSASESIVNGRDADGYQTLVELDAVTWVGSTAFTKLLDYVRANGLVNGGGGNTNDGGLTEGSPAVIAILKLCNTASVETLKNDVGLAKKVAKKIYNYRQNETIDTLAELDSIPNVGQAALNKLLDYVRANGLVNGGGGGGGGGGGNTGSFDTRLQNFANKYSTRVILATRRNVPAIFLKTSDLDNTTPEKEQALKEFYNDLYTTLGTNSLMAWNPAGSNFGHVAMGIGNNAALEEKFQGKAISLYSSFRIWDTSMGNMDSGCPDPCFKPNEITAERTVAVIKLSQVQLTAWNTYLNAIISDFSGTLGPTEYNGGIPPYFLPQGDTSGSHNCTSWITAFLNYEVSSDYGINGNPADMLKEIYGYWGDPEPDKLRAFLIFNHPNPPSAGDSIGNNFPLQYGH